MLESPAEQLQKRLVSSKPETLIRVLHVDDDADFLKCSKRILELHDPFQIETALSVKEALQKIRQKPYDVIVSDYQMPERNGLNLLKELRNRGNNVPFILFTGKGREEIAIEALNLGADRYFNKNGKPETVYGELSHSIIAAVNAKRAEKALQDSEEKYRKQFEEAMDAIFLADAETGILVDCNRAATKLVGRKKSELVGKHQRILHPPEAIEGRFSRSFRQHIAEKEGNVLEAQVITKSGEIKAVEIKANLFELGDKSVLQGIFRDVTNRKKIEEQLRRERETLELVTASIGAGLTIISKDYKILWANKFLKNVCGDVEGKTCYSVYNDRTSICPGCGVKEIFETGKNNVVNEQSVPGPGGQRIWVEITANPIRDENGNIVAASELSVFLDERRQLENKLREAENRYHALFNKAPLGILIIDSTGTAVEFNEEAHRQIGYSREEFAKLTVSDYEVLETPEETRARMEKTLKTGKDEFETKHRTKTGEIRDIINTVQLIELSGKKFFHVITRDITERKRAEEMLRESEKRFRDLSELLPEVVFETDANVLLTFVNQAAIERFGYSQEDFDKGLTALQMLVPEDRKRAKENIDRVLRGENIGPNEYTGLRKDATTFPFIINSTPIIQGNKTVGMRGVIVDITDLKKAEEALRESEKKYRELLNGMNDTAWVIDFDCNIIDVNDAAVEVMGYSREEFRSMRLTGIDSNLDPEEIKGLVEGMPADEIQVFETVHTTKDGKKIPVEISSSLVTYRGKRAILSIARDITERKKAREELRASKERYRTVFENTGTAMCILEEDKTISMFNRQFEEVSGYSRKEVNGKKWTEFVTKDCLKRMKKYHEARRKKSGKAPTHYSFDFITKKGQIKNCMITVNLIPGTKKSVASILDITESKKAEKALLEAEEKYRETIVNANVGVICYDPEGDVKILNPKMEQMTGFKRSEIPTLHHWFEKLYPNKDERCKIRDRWFKRMSEEGEVKEGQAIITTKDGKRRNFLFNGVRLESGDSISFAEDITERKEAEKKLDEIMNELVTINEKLGVVGRLTRHDARNKLSVIANNVYLAKQKLPANHNSLEFLTDVESAIDQMDKIFDFARTYEMLGVEELSHMDVGKSVEEAAILLSGMNDVKLVNECKGLTVMADSLLRQLFYNLIDNTMKHGEKVSQIMVHYIEGEDQLKLVYEDDGVGIPEDEKELIFKEGYGKSTGYGLYLIKKMCKEYGWTIRETGKQGKGAQFTITIPKTNKNGKIFYCFDNE